MDLETRIEGLANIHNVDLEMTIIGLALTDYDCAEKVAALPEGSFWVPEMDGLHKAITEIIKDHNIPNTVTLQTKLSDYHTVYMPCIDKCFRNAISVAMYKQLETELLDLRRRRRLFSACDDAMKESFDLTKDIDEIEGTMIKRVSEDAGKEESISASDALFGFIEGLNEKDTMIPTGIAGIDSLVGGLQNGMLAIIGARPKVGKTALGLSIALNVAMRRGPVLMVSLEMTPKEIITRMVSAFSGVDMHKLVTKNLDYNDCELLPDAYADINALPIRFSKATSPLQIRREASRMMRNGGLKMIMVDYIQLMRSDENKKSRYEEVSNISRELKLMAMELNVPILALTQFNRESEAGGQRRKPTMAEARDSGSIEQDANIFIIQYPPSEPPPGNPLHDYWAACQEEGSEFQILEVAANRQGPTGTAMVKFDKKHMRFITLRREE